MVEHLQNFISVKLKERKDIRRKERKEKDIRHALWCNLLVAIHLHSKKSAENSCF